MLVVLAGNASESTRVDAAPGESGEHAHMDFRQLGGSGFKVPVLTLGTATFGGSNEFFKAWGESDVKEATRFAKRHNRVGVLALLKVGQAEARMDLADRWRELPQGFVDLLRGDVTSLGQRTIGLSGV